MDKISKSFHQKGTDMLLILFDLGVSPNKIYENDQAIWNLINMYHSQLQKVLSKMKEKGFGQLCL